MNGIVGAEEVPVDGLEPADVVVRVGDEVHSEFACWGRKGGAAVFVRAEGDLL